MYNDRLRYAISEFFDISSTNITGFTLENTNKLIEPLWSTVSINGQSIIYEEEDNNNETIGEHMSNNASQAKHPAIRQSLTKQIKTVEMHR